MAKILIVDDRAANRQFLTTLLGYQKHRLLETADGAEGLRVARKEHPDLIISDILMPVMDGYEFARQLRLDPHIGNTPLVFSTAHYLSNESRELMAKCGVTSIISKPSEPEVVIDIVETALTQKAANIPPSLEPKEFCSEHLQLLTNKLSEKANELREAHQAVSTERAKVARELSDGKAQLAGIIGSAMDAIISIDSNERVLIFNDAAEKMFGCLAEETIGQSLDRFLPPRFRGSHSQHISEFAKRGTLRQKISATHSVVGLRSNGEEFPVEASISQIEIGNQKLQTVFLRDITERKQAELQRDRLAALVEASPDFIGFADAKTAHIQYINTHGRKMCGVSEDEDVTKLKIGDVHPPWMNDRLNDVILPSALRDGLWEGEGAFMHRDGHEIPVSMALLARKDAHGEVEIFYTVSRDITERKRAEAELRFQKSLLESQSEASIDGILVTSDDRKILSFNRRFADMWGVSKASLDARSDQAALQSVLDKLEHPKEFLTGVEYLYNHPLESAQDEIKLNDGRTLDRYTAPIKSAQDEYYGRVWFFRDITGRKRAENALRESEERYRDLIENARDIIYSHDLAGNFTSVNKAGEQILGYTCEEALRLNIADTTAPEYLGKAREMLKRKLAGEKVTSYEIEILAKDGTRVPVEVNKRIVYRDGVPTAVQAIARDITERRQLEDQLRQSQKMEAIGQLAGGVAHDFNNLLTAIIGYSDLAQRRIDDDHPLKGYLEEIKKAADRAANLTRQLLAFGRKQMLHPVTLNLDNVVSDMNKMLCRLIGEDIKLTAKLDPELRQINADPGQIEQVLVNLVVNARDAMPQGGNLTIETSNFEIDREYADTHIGAQPGKFVMLAVSDTGTGMDDATKARIFEPFFTTKEKGKGTGLGLSTVYGIVKQSGGYVWVYSELGHGTSFKIYLPQLETEITPVNSKSAEVPAPGGSETILLVEDDDNVRGLARKILEQAGYKVLDATNGNDAIRLWEEQSGPIHLLLTDVVMPETSGKEIADRLTSLLPTIRVLFMSGYTDEAIVHHGIVDSNVEFIQKPFSPAALAQKVRKVLDLKS